MIEFGDTIRNPANGNIGIVAADQGDWWDVLLANTGGTHASFPKGTAEKLTTVAFPELDAIADPQTEAAAATSITDCSHLEVDDPFQNLVAQAREVFGEDQVIVG